ncbi:NUDIX hydrolase [Acidovorax sp. sic0104]|uniref:NUDIX hydrolase n=1 Tax=Acidovorax sp. sic0104 TaxID=2854784 RepID=UPI0021077154|nr:NUDIX hydrolase [Acidovorax sp. sic0104]
MKPMAPSTPIAPRVRLRAAAVITRPGQVLLHRAEGDMFWALPGGGIEPGESAAQALVREMHEELGAAVEPGALACVVENFYAYGGVDYHEMGLYLHAQPQPGSLLDQTPGPYVGAEGHRGLEFAWFARASLAELDLRPAFLGEALATLGDVPGHVQHFVHRDPAPAPTDQKAPA